MTASQLLPKPPSDFKPIPLHLLRPLRLWDMAFESKSLPEIEKIVQAHLLASGNPVANNYLIEKLTEKGLL